MAEVTIRELRNHGGDVVDRVARGEPVTITRPVSRWPSSGRYRSRRSWPRRCSPAGGGGFRWPTGRCGKRPPRSWIPLGDREAEISVTDAGEGPARGTPDR